MLGDQISKLQRGHILARIHSLLALLEMRRVRIALWILLIIQVAIAIHISHPWMTGDSGVYLGLASGLRDGGYGTFPDGVFQPDALRPPGLPLVLAAWPFGLASLMVMQGGLYLLCIRLAEKAVGTQLLPLAVIYPFPAFYIATVGTEAWAMLAVTLAALLVARGSFPSYAAAGFAAGLGAMFRSDLLLLPIALAAYISLRHWRLTWVPIAAAAMVVAPYAAWNHHHFGRFQPTPVAGALGNSLWSASWQSFVSPDDLNALYQQRVTPSAEAAGLGEEVRRMNAAIGGPPHASPSNPASYADQSAQIRSSDVALQHALAKIASDPWAYAGHVVRNIYALWNTGNYPVMPPPVRLALLLVSAIVWGLALVGVILALRQPRLWGPLIVLLYVPAIHLWLHTEARYTAPVRPLMLAFASLAIITVAQRWRRRSPPAPGYPARR
jgi:hypothetical protein